MAGSTRATVAALVLMTGVLASCSESLAEPAPSARASAIASTAPAPEQPTAAATASPSAGPALSDGRPRRARLTIPALRLHDLLVVPYRGRTDDARGTRIQNRGVAASPHGPQGGAGPGGLGNYQVTAHRTSSTRAFGELPSLQVGQRVVVTAGRVRYVYEIVRTRETSFRSARSLAEQRAAVPGRPGAAPSRAFVTLSTCATPEDHAEGNYWSDEFHNPEHRIDKIGVLIRTADLQSVSGRPEMQRGRT